MQNDTESFKTFWSLQRSPLHAHADAYWFERYAKEILQLIPDAKVVIDAGCGSGELTAIIAPYVNHLYAFDFSQTMLDNASDRLKSMSHVHLSRLSIADICLLPVRNADAIYCNGVVQYLNKDQFYRFLLDARDLLRPGGRLVIMNIPNINARTLFLLGFYRLEKATPFRRVLRGFFRIFLNYVKNLAKGSLVIDDGIGFWYSMEEVKSRGRELNYQVEIVGSQIVNYYYRFHAVLTREV